MGNLPLKRKREHLKHIIEETFEEDGIMYHMLTQKEDSTRSERHGGSKRGKCANIDRGFEEAHQRIFDDYFAPDAVFPRKLLKRRYRMSREL